MISVLIVSTACGKKGPPLPPLVKVPAPPAEFSAVRRGADVDLQFTVPASNTDGTRPANVERVDVYAYTGPPELPDAQLFKLGTRVGSVPVKAPRDPDLTVDEDESDEIEPPEGTGLDQGAIARLREPLTDASREPIHATNGRHAPEPKTDRPMPLIGPPETPPIRTYVAVGIAKRGRKGPASKRVGVPLVPPPPPPSPPAIDYTETEITVKWGAAAAGAPPPPAGEGTLAAHPIGISSAEIAYNVYETAAAGETRLTKSPIAGTAFKDTRIDWGVERCYVVRTVETVGGVSVESDAPPPTCKTFADTFPPAAPRNLKAVPGEGSINLIWEPNNEKDVAGYVVLRGAIPGDMLEPVTARPIQDATYKDDVPAGVRYVYAVEAVDKAGNVSRMSNRVEETAR